MTAYKSLHPASTASPFAESRKPRPRVDPVNADVQHQTYYICTYTRAALSEVHK